MQQRSQLRGARITQLLISAAPLTTYSAKSSTLRVPSWAAAKGIGAAYAVGFALEGAKKALADVLAGKDAVEKAESEAFFIKTDASKQDQYDDLAKSIIHLGSISTLVSNTDIFVDIVLQPFIKIKREEKERKDMRPAGN